MNIAELNKIITAGESSTLEFKRSSAKLKSAAESLCAFLNGYGGTVLIGVSDQGRIVGQEVTDNTKREIANTLLKFEPTTNISIEYIKIKDNKHIIMLCAHPDVRSLPYSFAGRAYERHESSTSLMTRNKYQQLIVSNHLNPSEWELQPEINVAVGDLDEGEIIRTVTEGIEKNHIDSTLASKDLNVILTRFHLLTDRQVNNAGAVLFLKEIRGEFVQCTLRLARFKGIEKTSFIDRKQVSGNAFQLLGEAESFVRRNTAVAGHIEEGKMERIDEPEYPFPAVREALINAICHRDYSSRSGSITMTIYDDRLEIANTGLLFDITLDDLKKTHTSHPRNPTIVNVFYRRGLIEAMGMGTQEIISACEKASMKEPEFFEQAGTFVIRLWSRHYKGKVMVETDQLSEREKKILTILGSKQLSPQEILLLLKEKISDRTLRRDLQSLKDKNYVDNQGQLGPKTKWFRIKNPDITRT